MSADRAPRAGNVTIIGDGADLLAAQHRHRYGSRAPSARVTLTLPEAPDLPVGTRRCSGLMP